MLRNPADVSAPSARSNVLKEIHSKLGSDVNVDILVTAAGMTRYKTFESEHESLDSWWHLLGVNLRGTVSFIRAVLKQTGHSVQYCVRCLESRRDQIRAGFQRRTGRKRYLLLSLHPGSVQTDLAAVEGSVHMESMKMNERMASAMGAF
jgi:NAD(P)-dependent dehydrogenase (short-subunit alcohol dehydrogenase family)